jgi:hypothetical protein
MGDGTVGGALAAGFAAVAEDFAALVEVVLGVGADGVVGDEVEFAPEGFEFGGLFWVEDEFAEGLVVAIVAHDVVEAGAEEAAGVLGEVGEEAAAFADVEGVGEEVGEAGEGGFVAGALAGGEADGFGIFAAGGD